MKVLAVSATTLELLLDTCPTKYDYSRNHGLSPVNLDGAAADLDRGNISDAGLTAYYKHLKDKGCRMSFGEVEEVVRVEALNHTELTEKEVAKVITALKLYFEYYFDDGWEPLEVQKPFAVVLYEQPDTPEKEGVTILLQGRIDLKIRNRNGQEMIVDHKSEKQKRYPHALSQQNFSYCYAGDVRYICINYVGVQNSKDITDRLHRHIMSYSRVQIAEWRLETIARVLSAYDMLSKGWVTRNLGSCWKYGRMCEYLKICEADIEDRPQIIKNFYTVTRGPALFKKEEK